LINIIVSGSNGFIGSNWLLYSSKFEHYKNIPYRRDDTLTSQHFLESKKSVFLHLAGKAHDTHNVSEYDVYYTVNTDLTKKVFDEFLHSKIEIFIMISSVKAVADDLNEILTENFIPNPLTHYGKSKLFAEEYILSKEIPNDKRVYILRPCMIHGPGNKGNFNLLYNIVSKGYPWPLGSFSNKRSLCSIDNLFFIINELIDNNKIESGIYNIADDDPVSTNEIISLIAKSQFRKVRIWKIPKILIYIITKIGDVLRLPINSERFKKLTEDYIVSNTKIKAAINKPLPFTAKEGLIKTINSFNSNVK
jgi:nucleoside-diphosphate-sugar epimerase